MTEQEIKLELARLTITQENGLELAKTFYNWIMEEEVKYTQKPSLNVQIEYDFRNETLTKLIEEIDRLDEERKQNAKYKSAKSGFAHTVRYFFLSNEIKTLGELLSLGRKHVARCRNIGKMTMWAIDKALENLYGITEW